MKKMLALIAGLALASSACAGGRARIDYAAYAGDPVKQVVYFQLYNWQRSTDKAVVLWTKPSEAWYLTLAYNCAELRGVRVSIQVGGVAAVRGRLQKGDELIVGPMTCRISEIRPIDLQAIKRDRKS